MTPRTLTPSRSLRACLVGLPLLLSGQPLTAQLVRGESASAEAALLFRQMDGVKRVLMIAAHPDDEDSSLLAALSRGWGAETAYLSLTRGDGGQNLIGPELGEGLGVLRTGELEAARALDGGRQFFSRAFDFGYTKSAEETLRFWEQDEVLADAVWIIRTFRPQVIITQWTGTPRDGHGQHQAAGIIAHEAFRAAGDPLRFPEQLGDGVEAWQATKLYERFRSGGGEATTTVATGVLDPLLGRSWFQLGMASRSQHRSQDMGARQYPGPRTSQIELVQGPTLPDDGDTPFTDVDTALVSIVEAVAEPVRSELKDHLEAYRRTLERASEALAAARPWGASAPLAEGLAHLRAARERATTLTNPSIELTAVLDARIALAERALLATSVVSVDAQASDDLVVPGESLTVHVTLWNGGPFTLRAAKPTLELPEGWTMGWASEAEQSAGVRPSFFGGPAEGTQREGPADVGPGELARWSYHVSVPPDASLSRQYYLAEDREGAMYRWPADRSLWGRPRNPPVISASIATDLSGGGLMEPVGVSPSVPVTYLGVDPASGEFRKPVYVVPAVSVALDPPGMVWPEGSTESRSVTVVVSNQAAEGTRGRISLDLSEGFQAEPEDQPFSLATPGDTRVFTFQVRPGRPVASGEHVFEANAATDDGATFTEGLSLVDYPHIERVAMFHPARARVSSFPVRVAGNPHVGYVMGTGDDGPTALRQLGIRVDEIPPEAVRAGSFSDYDVIVLGVRAYEARPDLVATNAQLLDYVRSGGTVVAQYNQYAYTQGGFAPYPLNVSRDRVSVEDVPVTLLDPGAPVLSQPNQITEADFDGWVQERGLYFPDSWDRAWRPVISMADPGEEQKEGSLLVAAVGDGVYVYTSLSFFRQFPAGVPGAYRLFANLLSLTADRWNAYLARTAGH